MLGIPLTDEELHSEISAYIDEVWEDLVCDIDALVRIRSVEDLSLAAPGMPWGPASHEALVQALQIATRLGLRAHECEGYLGYADLLGVSTTQIATIAHSDVVPEGLGWHFDPFRVTRTEGMLVGRGVLDDKGPLVLSLYAARFFVRLVEKTGQRLPYTLRCIIGNDEETTMGDLTWYLKHYPEPAFCFSPDADFPLICGEKGLYAGMFRSNRMSGGRIVSLEGGTVSNAIPSQAEALVKAQVKDLPQAPRIEIESAGVGLVRICAHGIGGHASMPEGTLNAIGLLVDYLCDHDLCTKAERNFLDMERALLHVTDGSTVGLDCEDERFGPLTLIGGTLRTKDGCFEQTVDSRYPTCVTGERICRTLTDFAHAYGCTYEQTRDVPPFYVDPELPEIRCLLETYAEITGRAGVAFTIGGGTYARHFSRACAFGPHDPQDVMPDWAGPEHGPDEAIPECSLRRALEIYILSIARLMELPLGV